MMIDIPSPFQSSSVIGHDMAKTRLESAFSGTRMPHAWILAGTEGIGKTTFAVHAAHMLLSGGENRFSRFNPQHPAAKLVSACAHPDLYVLRRPIDEKTGLLKKSIPVEEARKVAPFLQMTASFGGARVALVEEAQKLTPNAQNALLKIIEEPTDRSYIFLVTTTLASLLPTIKSRCRVLTFEQLDARQLETVFMRLGALLPESPSDKARFLSYCEGSAGFGLRLLQSGAFGVFEEVMDLLKSLPNLDIGVLNRLAESLGKKGDDEVFEVVSRLLSQTLRRIARAAALGQADDTGLAAKLSSGGRLDKLLDLWEKTDKSLASVQDSSLDKKLVFMTAILDIKRCAE